MMILVKVTALAVAIFYADGRHDIRTTDSWTFTECVAAAELINAMPRQNYPEPDKITAMRAGCLELNAFVPGDNA
jgi:hypothetical protein